MAENKPLQGSQVEKIESIRSVKEGSEILNLYLAGNSISEIATQLQLSTKHVSERLADLQASFSHEMYELAEQLMLINLGRAEMLIKAVMPLALKADLRAVKAFTDLAKLEIEWRKEVKPPSHDEAREADDDTIVVEAFEQTLSSSSSLYDVALGHINEDWLSRTAIPVDDIYGNDPDRDRDKSAMEFAGIEPLDTRIGKIEDVIKSLDKTEDSDDGYDTD